MYQTIIGSLIAIFGIINIIRIGFFMIGSDIYTIKDAYKQRRTKLYPSQLPPFSVVIPAHNEENTIINTVKSVLNADYPQEKLQIIVVDDGSTDDTWALLQKFAEQNPHSPITLVTQPNAGKAHALNNAIANHSTGKLIMCLDADSSIEPNALKESVRYFRDRRVVAMAANVRIRPTNSLLNFAQRYEYIIGYQLKKALTTYNIEYIVGGIGSVFRRSALQKVDYYDTDTITEDIDLTMKFLARGGKKNRVVYGAEVVAYTEGVMDFSGMIKQRYRWKFGRLQTFFKNRDLFFNSGKQHNRILTWLYLPFVIYADLAFLLEPLLLGFLIYLVIYYGDLATLISSMIIICGYVTLNVLMESTIHWKTRLKMAVLAPSMYFFFHALNVIEYIVVIKALFKTHTVKRSVESGVSTWQHVERPKIA